MTNSNSQKPTPSSKITMKARDLKIDYCILKFICHLVICHLRLRRAELTALT